MSVAFKRVYIDIPPDVHERLKTEAQKRGTSQKALLAELIEKACKPVRKSRSKKKGK